MTINLDSLKDWITNYLAILVGEPIETIDVNKQLLYFDLDAVDAGVMGKKLSATFGIAIDPEIFLNKDASIETICAGIFDLYSSSNPTPLKNWIKDYLANLIGEPAETIDTTNPLSYFDLDSIDAVVMATKLSDEFGIDIHPETFLAEEISIDKISKRIFNRYLLRQNSANQ
ncbi:acyl carrier protein [Desulfovibrio inopinatus]|uniref:acyl carrier protein n=1 Tax=Desulfovibrio inopinatus TaxID=102109 RepID=UPI0004231349|nr:acyl carrier protein [Desulfovibrio inopinatus]